MLLTVCGYAAGLQLAHTWGRRRELAIRAALGGGQGRLLRQFSDRERSAVDGASGAVGVVVAAVGERGLVSTSRIDDATPGWSRSSVQEALRAWVHGSASVPCTRARRSPRSRRPKTVPASGGSDRGQRSAHLGVDAVVVAGALDEPLEGWWRPQLARASAATRSAWLRRFSHVCSPRFARLHVRPSVGFSVTRISPMVRRPSARACGAVALPFPEPNVQREGTGAPWGRRAPRPRSPLGSAGQEPRPPDPPASCTRSTARRLAARQLA